VMTTLPSLFPHLYSLNSAVSTPPPLLNSAVSTAHTPPPPKKQTHLRATVPFVPKSLSSLGPPSPHLRQCCVHRRIISSIKGQGKVGQLPHVG